MITAKVTGLENTISNLRWLERESGFTMAKLVKDFIYRAGESAAKWSRPKPGKSYKATYKSKRWGKRPVVPMRGDTSPLGPNLRKRFTYVKRNNQMFSTNKKISKKERDKQGLKEVKQAVKYWHKKGNKWAYAPINPNTKKPNQKRLRTGRQIPAAAAIKAGWIHASARVGKSLGGTPGLRSRLGEGLLKKDKAFLLNKVRYGKKVSPGVVRIAEKKAWKGMLGYLWVREKRRLESKKL